MNPRVTRVQLHAAVALETLASIRAHLRWRFLRDDSSLLEPSIDLVGLAGHRQVTDMHLMNLAARHGAVLVTFDQGIGRAVTTGDQQNLRTL